MGILSWLGGGADEAAPAADKQAARTTDIQYDAGLIEKLKSDHERLVAIFSEISAATSTRRYHDIPQQLAKFKIALQAHIMTENVKFYVYLQNKLSHDETTSEYVTDLRREMDGIARAVVRFANTHASTVLTDETAGAFAKQLGEIGEILLQRVELEESRLYTLYAE